ncbi:MAG: hypothetical protein ACI9DK_000757 [Vicingaceae bacterium]|jgi:hypothetical protein
MYYLNGNLYLFVIDVVEGLSDVWRQFGERRGFETKRKNTLMGESLASRREIVVLKTSTM